MPRGSQNPESSRRKIGVGPDLSKLHSLKPHRNRYFLQITDPDFFPKREHLILIYQNPPEYLFCFDESTCLQAKARFAPDLPVQPGHPHYERARSVLKSRSTLHQDPANTKPSTRSEKPEEAASTHDRIGLACHNQQIPLKLSDFIEQLSLRLNIPQELGLCA